MEKVKVSLQEVSDLANKIKLLNNNMYETLNKTKDKINELNNIWSSDGSDAIRTKFNTLSSRFEMQRETIDTYSNFLTHAVNSYDTLESTIVFNANAINE